MSSVDTRVVDMQFNNKQFENGIATSMKSLSSLNQKLNSQEGVNGLDGIAKGVDTIKSKFSAMSIIAITALQNLANRAVDFGVKIVKALSIDAVIDGFKEYEQKMNTIQVIFSNTNKRFGTTHEEIDKKLDELNAYADKTVYNFGNMTAAVGKFTAAGNTLDDSVAAIKGISNAGAALGSTPAQVENVMTQLGQSLASGRLQLQDWNSVVAAGMGGPLFQEGLIDAAVAVGDVSKATADAVKKGIIPFREAIKATSGKAPQLTISAKAMMKAFGGFAEDPMMLEAATQIRTFTQLIDTAKEAVGSGWGKSFEHIIGNQTQAIALFTPLSKAFENLIGGSIDARNAMLKFWNANGGRDAIINGITKAVKFLGQALKPISDAFREVFPKTTGKQLVEMSKKFEAFTSKLKLNDATLSNLKATFKGIFSFFSLVGKGVSFLVKTFGALVKAVLPVGDGFLGITGGIGKFLTALNEGENSADSFNKAFQKVKSVIEKAGSGIKYVVDKIRDALSKLFSSDTSKMNSFTETLGRGFEKLATLGVPASKALDGIKNAFQAIKPVLEKVGTWFKTIFGKIASSIKDFADKTDFNASKLLSLISTGAFIGVLTGIRKFFKGLTDTVGEGKEFISSLKGILSGVSDAIGEFTKQTKAKTLLYIAGAIGILAVSFLLLSLVDVDKMGSALAAMSVLIAELMLAMKSMQKTLDKGGLDSVLKVAVAMLLLAISVGTLAKAMVKIAQLDWDGVARGLAAVGLLMLMLVKSAKGLSKYQGKLIGTAAGLVVFAIAINTLTKAVKKLGEMDTEVLIKGLIGVGVLIGELVIFLKLIGKPEKLIATATGLTILSVAMSIFAGVVGKFGEMSWESLAKGGAAIAVILGELALFLKLMGNPKNVISSATGLTILAGALVIIAGVVGKFGEMSWEGIAKGLGSITVVLVMIAAAMRMMPKNLIGIGAGLVIVGASLLIISDAMNNFGKMTWEEIGKGLVALAGGLAIIAIALIAMKKSIAGAAALTIAAVAILLFTPALMLLGSMSLAEIGKALLVLAGTFIILGIAGAVLGPLTPAILALSTAIVLLGVGIAAIGLGILAFASGLVLLEAAGAGAVAVFVYAVEQLIALIPYIAIKLAEGMVAFALVIKEGAPIIGDAVVAVIKELIRALTESIPDAIDAVFEFLSRLLDTLVDRVPEFTDKGMKIIIGFLKGISDNIQEVTYVALEIIANFIRGIADGLPTIIDAAFYLILQFIDGLIDGVDLYMADIVSKIFDLGGKIIKGLIDGILSGMTKLGETMVEVAKKAVDTFKSWLGFGSKDTSAEFEAVGKSTTEGFADGFDGQKGKVENSAKNMTQTALDGVKKGEPEFKKTGEDSFSALLNGFSGKLPKFETESKKVGKSGAKAAKETTPEFEKAGSSGGDGFIKGLSGKNADSFLAGSGLAESALSGAKKKLDSHSPSKEFEKLGVFGESGFVNGLLKFAGRALHAGAELGGQALDGLKSSISRITEVMQDDVDFTPVIRPVVDLDGVRAGSDAIDGLLNGNRGIGVSSSTRRINELASLMSRKVQSEPGSTSSDPQPITYTQNNYSPKALSRIEIYRQTRNLVSTKGPVVPA